MVIINYSESLLSCFILVLLVLDPNIQDSGQYQTFEQTKDLHIALDA